MTTQAQLGALRRLGAATVHEAQGGTGAMDSAIKPLDPTMVLAGPALTVDTRPSDNLAIHRAMTVARPGDVLVVDAKGFTEAGPWGDVLTVYAQQVGLAGLVIDGSVRDSRAIVELGFPVFSRGVCIKGTAKNQPGAVGRPITCAGVAVHPGDVVLGDADGVVVVPAAELDRVLAAAEERERKEERFRAALRDGESLLDLLNLRDRLTDKGNE
ncbi:4-carboxy-4-hydroxy-2-oxoadipate aldolase/oxaloacetate decarboxylase [Pseudonocardia acaciae]|uniref:4-carboxy-4-hydroxy-2-oxoadipate aldolase/oxaloacetate decarboxylase n=1 Tax=Pseudonocardia acaciae TaxID=551276 RepID=UPI00048EB8E5|nr:4-carboxy-4-hydroxy-2-oxoadipate aldolase/oxaloacetate decarboxylase [Pseudonocardia acaciae]